MAELCYSPSFACLTYHYSDSLLLTLYPLPNAAPYLIYSLRNPPKFTSASKMWRYRAICLCVAYCFAASSIFCSCSHAPNYYAASNIYTECYPCFYSLKQELEWSIMRCNLFSIRGSYNNAYFRVWYTSIFSHLHTLVFSDMLITNHSIKVYIAQHFGLFLYLSARYLTSHRKW